MTEPRHEDTSLISTPKSSSWRAFLVGMSAVATALIYELARNLVVDSVGDNPGVKAIVETVLWLPVIIAVSAGAVYVLYRLRREFRERHAAARESDLIADLVVPGRVVGTGLRLDMEHPTGQHGAAETTVVQASIVIDALPIDKYRTAALLSMLAAMLDAPARRPDVLELPGDKAIQLLNALLQTRLELTDAQHCRRRPRSPQDPAPRLVPTDPMWRAALPTLLRYHADLAHRWSIALDRTATAAGARRWFVAEAPYLHELVIVCATSRLTPGVRELRLAIMADLIRIADALDSWYAVCGYGENVRMAGERIGIATAMRMVTQDDMNRTDPLDPTPAPNARSGFRLFWELARIRAGEVDEPDDPGDNSGRWRWFRIRGLRDRYHRLRDWCRLHGTGYRPRQTVTSLGARAKHAAALRRLAQLSAHPESATSDRYPAVELLKIERDLERAWRRLPRADIAGEVAALVNLAVVHQHQGRLEAATDRLELAESLTRDGRNPHGSAHIRETMGGVWWARGEPDRALRCWQSALRDYLTLADELGIARNLQHLGSAAIVAPEHGGLLLGDDGELTTTEVLRQATLWLNEAIRRGGDITARNHGGELAPVVRHAEYYRGRAVTALNGAGIRVDPSAEIDRWPLAVNGG
ncbi:hypothetical protein HLB23_02280 [Nocardia uniformis]|uniref:Tetratricopeptide repeat protein n=1 Tax=Nocardia uniformis TaxID=53432 RepID=A0A849BYG8_9NOCA|nr:hypothetical protein [Nocardia uniformis]NNH68717.1 hypothetical protein [Nocardia uniformis]